MFEALTLRTASYILAPLYLYFGAGVIANLGVSVICMTGGAVIGSIKKWVWRKDADNYLVFNGEKIKIERGFEYHIRPRCDGVGNELVLKKID